MDALPSGTALHQGDYVLESVLGQGGFGITYRASDARSGQAVAIKECFPQGCRREGRNVVPGDHHSKSTFEKLRPAALAQAQVLTQLRHRGLAVTGECFEENDTVYLVMELAEGPSLQEWIEAEGPLPPERATTCIRQLAEALEAFHSLGFLHLDVKPQNTVVLREADGPRLVLIDFDMVQAWGVDDLRTRPLALAARHGTPGYAPPEQYGQQAVLTPASDVYALGATFHHLLTGRPPSPAPERARDASLPVKAQELPAHLERALTKALALKAEDRPASAADFLAQLEPPRPVAADTGPIPAAYNSGYVYKVFVSTADPLFPPRCVCCFDEPELGYEVRSPNGRWTLPLCKACEKHQHAARLSGTVTVWGMVASLAVALSAVGISIATESFWPILLGPAGIFINVYSMSYGGLKNSRAEEMMKDVCTDLSKPVTHVFNGQVHIWRFKNPVYARDFKALNAAYVV
jgi:serine/threonine protein kinase